MWGFVGILRICDVECTFIAWQDITSWGREEISSDSIDPSVLISWFPVIEIIMHVKTSVVNRAGKRISISFKILDSTWIYNLYSWCMIEFAAVMPLKMV
jgi:hypothetical protein